MRALTDTRQAIPDLQPLRQLSLPLQLQLPIVSHDLVRAVLVYVSFRREVVLHQMQHDLLVCLHDPAILQHCESVLHDPVALGFRLRLFEVSFSFVIELALQPLICLFLVAIL